MSALGEAFRSAREARGLTLSDVAEHIHIRSVYLGAIEDEEWSSIGAPVYVRGFIRTYARFLGLDAEDAVARFSAGNGSGASITPSSASAATHTMASTRAAERGGPSVWALAGVLVALVLIAVVGFEYYQYRAGAPGGASVAAQSPQPTPVATGSVSQAEASAAPSSEPSALVSGAKNSIAIRLTERSWLRVTVDGGVAMEGVFPSGTIRSFTGKNASVRAGNAGGVDLTVSGKNVGTMGATGDVVERTFSLQ